MIQTSDIRDALLDERGGRGEFQVRAGNGAKKKNPEPGEREIEQSSAASTGVMSEDFDGGIKKRIIESDRARGSRQEKISEWLQVGGGSWGAGQEMSYVTCLYSFSYLWLWGD